MENEKNEKQSVSWKGYVALIFAAVFFSGAFAKSTDWLGMFDFNVLTGGFGTMKDAAKATFYGQGGTGAKDGFLFALGLFPTVMFALGVVELVEHYGGLKAAQRLLNPLLRPLLGLPGATGLAIISSFQSTDAGAGMTKTMRDEGIITERERTVFCAFQFSAGGTVTNYMATGSALFAALKVPILLPLIVIIAFKFFGANLMRLYLKSAMKEEE